MSRHRVTVTVAAANDFRETFDFPHGILYAVQEDEVIVVALAHPKRDPRIWIQRTR